VFVEAIDLAEDWIEGMFQRPVDRIALGRAELVEVPVDSLARVQFGLAMPATQVSRHVFAGEDSLGDVVEHPAGTISFL
jgi:hypothetical protein